MRRLLEHMHNKRLLNCIYKMFTMPDGSEKKVRHYNAVSNIVHEIFLYKTLLIA